MTKKPDGSDADIVRQAMQILGRRKSPAKAKAARENLRKAAKARKK